MNSNLNLITETSFSLQGKKILITGATSGIGRQVAIDCARFGAQLILSARSEERMEEVMAILDGDSHSSILGDLTEPETIKRIVSSIDSVDGIVLCAGIGKTLPFKFCTRDNFDEVYEVNFFSQLELLRNLVRGKHISKNASVVFMSSIGGLNVFTPGNIIYGSSKAALDSAMKFCALEIHQQSWIRHTADFPRRYQPYMRFRGKPAAKTDEMGICRTCQRQQLGLLRC